MAATDQSYRNQRALDIVFAVTSILMLFSILWMFVQDYNREFKKEQRQFRDVEAALAQRLALDQLPSTETILAAEKAVEEARAKRKVEYKVDPKDEKEKPKSDEQRLEQNRHKIHGFMPRMEKIEGRFQAIKADLASRISFYDIEMEKNPNSILAQSYKKEIEALDKKLEEAKKEKDAVTGEIMALRKKNDDIDGPLTEALGNLKKVTDKFDTQVKVAVSKQWSWYDWLRNLPILDGFAPPLKIHQFTIEDVPIDYNFKYATRFDRCMTCHQGIDRPAYTKEALASLTSRRSDQRKTLDDARDMLVRRKEALRGLPEAASVPDPSELKLTKLSKSELTPVKINEFCAHPRLDLFVGADSKHPAERFGCTSCHAGQGSATSFTLASHSPNDYPTEKRWKKEHDWASNHYWDFPMLPTRFIESSCLKCHYQVTDLIGSNNRPEAPKLLHGYNLLKEFGCFGCHEINGRKKGRAVGPDLRLEPYPPLDDLTAAEQAKIEADPDTAPGSMRKVGPSLFRIVEKTNPEWTAKWLRAPREFRPDTKMPHFYGLSNNHPDVLPKNQKEFPDVEIQAVTYYLFKQSETFIKDVTKHHQDKADEAHKDRQLLQALQGKERLDDKEKQELDKVRYRIKLRETPLLVDMAPGYKGDAAKGRILFSERGCLACHSHDGTETAVGKKGAKDFVPAIAGKAQFGPNLSQIKDKLGSKANDPESARTWLIQWVLDPHVHSPRSRMPVTHLTPEEAADIAAWLLAQPAQDLGGEWKSLAVKQPDMETMKSLANVYLVRLLSASDRARLASGEKLEKYVIDDLPKEEKELASEYNEHNLKMYLGRKAIFRLGCFACHDIPGYESAKPIGVELNEWGKKDPTRLAFENIKNFVDNSYHKVDRLTDKEGKPIGPEIGKDGKSKAPYERFFYDLLEHHQREGFLNQKLLDPRSYDYERDRAWDDRARMPQFRFARARKHKDEKAEDFEARAAYEEAQAREAVMTFVLGLVAEPIPMKSVNQPSGDRLAEVKGRQVLDKYNCAGCHLVRPGYLEFNANEDVTRDLDSLWKRVSTQEAWKVDHVFPEHRNWVGPYPPSKNTLAAFGTHARIGEDEPVLSFRLSHALRFQGTDKDWHDFRAFSFLTLPTKDMVYPPQGAMASNEKLEAFMRDRGPYGGAFADLLVPYLTSKKENYAKNEFGDSSDARAELPPSLIGQGERAQTEWLYQFLLNPQPLRRMTVLRMPKFNMSKEEAKALVSYFAAVEKINNPGIGLHYPYEAIAQQESFDAPYWRQKTADYVAVLKRDKLYQGRVNDLLPIWKQVLKDSQDKESAAKAKYETAKSQAQEAESAAKKAEDALKGEKDEAKKKALESAFKAADELQKRVKQDEFFWSNELNRLQKLVEKNKVETQEDTWKEQEAYVTDAFRLLANTELCLKCHQLGDLRPGEGVKEGPPLSEAFKRLRPEWARRWISDPVRLHDTVMPINFPAGSAPQYQQWFAGSSLDQATAVRDVLMAYPRVAALPANRYWILPLVADKKAVSGEKK